MFVVVYGVCWCASVGHVTNWSYLLDVRTAILQLPCCNMISQLGPGPGNVLPFGLQNYNLMVKLLRGSLVTQPGFL